MKKMEGERSIFCGLTQLSTWMQLISDVTECQKFQKKISHDADKQCVIVRLWSKEPLCIPQ